MVQEMGFLFINKIKQNNKNYPVGEKQDSWQAWQGRTGHDKADRTHSRTFDDEPARDCKHKEIIKGANEEGNEENTGGAN